MPTKKTSLPSECTKLTLTQQVNNAIVAYVTAAHARSQQLGVSQGCTFAELYDVFDKPDLSGPRNLKTPNTPLRVFRSRVQYLVDTYRLQATGTGMAREFSPFMPGAMDADADQPAPYVEAYQGTITPPRQVDVMHGALYVPEVCLPARARSLDYKRLPSVGHRC